MRTKQWKRKKTMRSIKRKAAILQFKDIYGKDKYLEEENRLDKISISDLELFDRPKYKRSSAKRELLFEINLCYE